MTTMSNPLRRGFHIRMTGVFGWGITPWYLFWKPRYRRPFSRVVNDQLVEGWEYYSGEIQ